MSSEEHNRWEGEPAREPSEEEEVSEPAETEGSEDPGVVPKPELSSEAEEPETEPEAEPENVVEMTETELLALANELEAARRERDEYLDDMRRMKAEMENSRKRLERERTRFVQLATERLVGELLPVLDNLERALAAEGDVREGVQATREQLVGVLEREGLETVVSDGESFDPAIHEAIMGQPSEEHEEDMIIHTLERGYVLNGKPIRPAKVIVSKQA